MSTNEEIWAKLENKEYRKLLVEQLAKRAFATQVRTIRKCREWSQEKLAKESDLTQGVVSRTEDPNLGTTFDTAAEVASGFDLAFIPKIVTFSEFVRWVQEVSEGFTDLPTFEEEKADVDGVRQTLNQEPLVAKKKPPAKAAQAWGSGDEYKTPDEMAAQLSKGGQSSSGDLTAIVGRGR